MFFRRIRARLDAIERHLHFLSSELSTIKARVDGTSAVKLSAELDDVRAGIEVHAKSLRKLWGVVSREKRDDAPEPSAPTRDQLRSSFLPKPGH